jgi:outer membrane receptor protein involved in Fe transport
MEPLGSQRLPGVKLLNLRAAKRLRFGAQALSLQFDLYNALNTNGATARSVRSGPTYGRITAIVPPRVARLGVTYSF